MSRAAPHPLRQALADIAFVSSGPPTKPLGANHPPPKSDRHVVHAAATHEHMEPLRVLVVEDNPVIGALLAEMLSEMGHQVCAIEVTEADAVIAAVRCLPQLMIVDVRLGDGSGVAAVDKIRNITLVPYILVSGDISRIRALRPDAVVLQKPYYETDLVRAIAEALAVTPSPPMLRSA